MIIDGFEYIKADSIPQMNTSDADYPWEIGKPYFIQTVTHYYLGRLTGITENELVVCDASWVANTGRFNEFIDGGEPAENEPYRTSSHVIISRGALISATIKETNIEVIE